ncbi:RTA1-domain-containing protein [Aspergillus sclerotioniger CBS 115572]|uniref:RTA1-domain-containing protein n=1 Tax=Aspergillus sclerotioniger CBS 115572 TaxID=1450535 RepID=A0A317W7F0_9EURO|nr:RTA1-domain-containing protein [Aspergillus sclerotioniger CBS 115572]PWY81601.1 RTA1-domain-containing protein [Aspergillus sclerotioniger CBS 115572]
MSSNDNDLYVGCKAYNPGFSTSYGYIPFQAAGIAFCVLFGLSMVVHIIQFCWKRTWWCSVFSIGCMVEVLGWAGRLWAAECPYNSTAFMIQISTLIIAPTFFTAGIYVLLGRFIQLFGRQSSILSPKRYLWIFCTCDIVSLVIQAAGGGLASSESNEVNGDTSLGTNIMVAGIVFQLVSLTIFVICAVDFFRRSLRLGYLGSLIQGSLSYLLFAMVFSVVCIYIRSIYRTIELAQGWTGYLITHQIYFIVLDGIMMVMAVGIFNIFHPGWLLPSDMTFVLPKDRAIIDLGDPEAQQLHSSTEYTGYGHR